MNTIAKELKVKNKCEYYTKEDNILRKAIMNFVIDNKRPFHIEKDLGLLEVDLNIESINKSLENLKENNGFVLNDNNEAIFVYPVSALPTNHLVTLEDGRKFNAMCAIDAMGTAFTFNQNIEVKSKCSNTNREISVEIVDGEIKNYSPSDLHVLHVDLNKYTDWGKNCWNIMNFFCTEKDFDVWVDKMKLSDIDIFKLHVTDAVYVSKELFEFR